jgi:hypothetical protein
MYARKFNTNCILDEADIVPLIKPPFMKKALFLLVFTAISLLSFSQTKRIAHRSHSGTDKTFTITASADNFGLPVPDSTKKIKKDTLKSKQVIKDTAAARDSIKTVPKSSSDSSRRAYIHKKVDNVLSEMMYICKG